MTNTPMNTEFRDRVRRASERFRVEDADLRVFDSTRHRYDLNPPLGEAELRAFEERHDLTLPPDYRYFLREIGNGGLGPYYGISPLASGANLSQPFPARQTTDVVSIDDLEDFPGVLEVSEYGCGGYYHLVVRGDCYGQVWFSESDSRYAAPSFYEFYTAWLNRLEDVLPKILANERRVAGVGVGTPLAEIETALEQSVRRVFSASGDDKARSVYFTHLATAFTLDARDHVVDVVRYSIVIDY
jgi:hypothetical protein